MSFTKGFLKAIIAYYIAQITILHLYMVFIRPSPAPDKVPATPKNSTQPEPETIERKVISYVDVKKVRDYLTQGQLEKLHKEVDEADDDDMFFASLANAQLKIDKLAMVSKGNIKTIQVKEKKIPLKMDELKKMKPTMKRDNKLDLRKPEPTEKDLEANEYLMEDMKELQGEVSFEGLSDKELSRTFDQIITRLSQLNHTHGIEFDGDEKEDDECDAFLSREVTKAKPGSKTVFNDGKYATKKELEQMKLDTYDYLDSLRENPRQIVEGNDEFSKRLFQDFANAYEKVRNKIDDRIEYLESFAEEIEFYNKNADAKSVDDKDTSSSSSSSPSCVKETSVMKLWEEALEAMMTGDKVSTRLKNLVATMDPSQSIVVEDLAKDIISDDKRRPSTTTRRTLKDAIDTPLYPKVIEKIDQAVEFVAGYNDMVDQAIDYIGGKEEDGESVGKNLAKNLNRLLEKVELPHDLEDLKRRVDFDGFKKKLGLDA